MARLFIVEDDASLRENLVRMLKLKGHECLCCESFANAAGEALAACPDCILLDLSLPGAYGHEVCRSIRQGSNVPIIVLTSSDSEFDEVMSMNLGADDYVTKPFSPAELTARVDAIYRRVCMSFIKNEKQSVIESGPFVLNLKSRTVTKNGAPIELTQVEYQILEFFMNNKNTALDRASILNHIWGESYYGDDKIVDVNIRRIRMKIEEEPSSPKYIITIWGYGYKWNDTQ
mgnify:CR=1 FL=1